MLTSYKQKYTHWKYTEIYINVRLHSLAEKLFLAVHF